MQAQQPASAGDPIPPNCEVIEVHVAELKQLFNAIDPSPFREKDLDPDAEEFIVGWDRETPGDALLALVVYLDRPASPPKGRHERHGRWVSSENVLGGLYVHS